MASQRSRTLVFTLGAAIFGFSLDGCGYHRVPRDESPNPDAFDFASSLNHPPELLDVTFKDHERVATRKPQVVCATAIDADRDSIEWRWEIVHGPTHAAPVVLSKTHNRDGSITQCVQVKGGGPGKLNVAVTIFDQVLSPDGQLERVEQWLAEQGHPSYSRASAEASRPARVTRPVARERPPCARAPSG
jgi:hypothetical protein